MKKERMWDSNKENKLKRQTKRNTKAKKYKERKNRRKTKKKGTKEEWVENAANKLPTDYPVISFSIRQSTKNTKKINEKMKQAFLNVVIRRHCYFQMLMIFLYYFDWS
jgi:hypothetical protein